MAFNRSEVSALLVKVHRRCCICHRFCGIKIETDHIIPAGEGGDDNIDNAIPVCFECHAEIHSYNPQHPRGRKYMPDELRAHKAEWLRICETHPSLLVAATSTADVGPLQALIDELEYALAAGDADMNGALFSDEQFRRAIAHGAVATLEPTLKGAIVAAYAAMSASNERARALMNLSVRDGGWGVASERAGEALAIALQKTRQAHNSLLSFLSSDAG